MSLGSALQVARSGLMASQTWADTTSRNIANATQAGYVRKDVQFTTRNGTVEVSGIQRDINAMLDRLDRSEASKLAHLSATRDGLEVYTAKLGQPEDGTSHSARLNEFRQAFQTLSSKPGDAAVQGAVVEKARQLAAVYRESDTTLNMVRSEVLMNISYDVADVNKVLRDISKLNDSVSRLQPGSIGFAEVEDEMGRLIDQAANFVDIRTTQMADGQVNLYTASGTALIEEKTVSRISFDQATDTLSAGGVDITPFRAGVRGFDNGSLAGLIAMENTIIPRFQTQLDEGARMLVESFEGADASLTAGQAGLFTDDGNAYNPADLTGLAGRLQINTAVDPTAGGQTFRMRDGMVAATPGPAGDPTQVNAFLDVFTISQTVAPNAGMGTGMMLQSYTETMVARQHSARADATTEYDRVSISAESIGAARRNSEGVNTDQELQQLMLIEQSYAANARMMTAASEMIDTLLRAV